MSEKTQKTQTDGPEDLLEQIITHELEKINAPARTTDAREAFPNEAPLAPEQEDGEETPLPADRKNRRSSVYLYLLILFGAAFLMLLLAYFVQRRSSEDTISDLRDSMNLSRQELLDEIQELKDKNAELEWQNLWLEDGYNRMIGELSHWRDQYAEQTYNFGVISEAYANVCTKLVGWENSWLLEQSYQAGDYEDCIALILLENMNEYGSTTPNKEIADRREEITQTLIDRGLFPEDRVIRISDYRDIIDAYLAKHPDYDPANIEWE